MDGVFKEGDTLLALVGPYHEDTGGTYARVGEGGVTRIEVAKAAGPTGWYAVAQVFVSDELTAIYPLHMLSIAVVSDAP